MTGLRVGLIGSGYMGKCHALAWNSVAPVYGDVARPVLSMLAEASGDLARERAAALGFARATGDWRDIVADRDIDVVSITTPNAFHAEMAIAALEAGKHVWCEKPMAPTLAEAEAMAAAARASGRVALLGYNYIQNPAVRLIARLLADGTIGRINHLRIEMDEDFMADPDAPFSWRSDAAAGYGALDDFAVHPLSLIHSLVGLPAEVFGEMAKPWPDRPSPAGRRAVETWDIAAALLRFSSGASGTIQVSRTAWGRKGRIFVQLFGDRGTIAYDQERLNEVQLFVAEGPSETRGFRTILMTGDHPPFGRFTAGAGHQLGFNELKTMECRALIGRIAGEAATAIDFADGLAIERTVHAIARSFREGRWIAL